MLMVVWQCHYCTTMPHLFGVAGCLSAYPRLAQHQLAIWLSFWQDVAKLGNQCVMAIIEFICPSHHCGTWSHSHHYRLCLVTIDVMPGSYNDSCPTWHMAIMVACPSVWHVHHCCTMFINVAWTSSWHGISASPSLGYSHLCGMFITVAWPSMQHGHQCVTAINMSWPSTWHGHHCGMAILAAQPSLRQVHHSGLLILAAWAQLWHAQLCSTFINAACPSLQHAHYGVQPSLQHIHQCSMAIIMAWRTS